MHLLKINILFLSAFLWAVHASNAMEQDLDQQTSNAMEQELNQQIERMKKTFLSLLPIITLTEFVPLNPDEIKIADLHADESTRSNYQRILLDLVQEENQSTAAVNNENISKDTNCQFINESHEWQFSEQTKTSGPIRLKFTNKSLVNDSWRIKRQNRKRNWSALEKK